MGFIDFFKRILPISFLNSLMPQQFAFYKPSARQFDDLEAAITDTQNQFFIDSATWSLPVYEAEFAIKLADPNVSDDARRNSVMAMSRGGLGATPAAIKSVLESYGYETQIPEDFANYKITIKFTDTRGVPPNLADLQSIVQKMIPGHLELQWQFIYTQYRELANYTYGQMAAQTYDYLTTQLP